MKEKGIIEPNFTEMKHNELGDYLIKHNNVCLIGNVLHIYRNGIYLSGSAMGINPLHQEMTGLNPRLTEHARKEVCKYLLANPNTPVRTVSSPRFIPFKTSVYDLELGIPLKYTPEFCFLTRFPYDYKPDAPETETVSKLLRQLTGGDNDIIDLLLEAIGNIFYLCNEYRGAIMLYGHSGNNGKSTLLNMIRQLAGDENVASLAIKDLNDRFRLAGLYGKAVNIGDDISSTYLSDTTIFNKAITGESLTAENKGQNPFTFRSFAKHFYAMNKIPYTRDKSGAFLSRAIMVPLTQDFTKNLDTSLKNRNWTDAEMEDVVNRAMQGLFALRIYGAFSKPDAVRELSVQYEYDNNPIKEFCDMEDGKKTFKGRYTKDVYSSYKEFCLNDGLDVKKIPSRRVFTREVTKVTGLKVDRETSHLRDYRYK